MVKNLEKLATKNDLLHLKQDIQTYVALKIADVELKIFNVNVGL